MRGSLWGLCGGSFLMSWILKAIFTWVANESGLFALVGTGVYRIEKRSPVRASLRKERGDRVPFFGSLFRLPREDVCVGGLRLPPASTGEKCPALLVYRLSYL